MPAASARSSTTWPRGRWRCCWCSRRTPSTRRRAISRSRRPSPRCRSRVHLGLYRDETGTACQWHVPAAHFLEAWGDVRGHDGTASIQQPLIESLRGGRSAIELLAAIVGRGEQPGLELVRDYWRRTRGNPADFERLWEHAVGAGRSPTRRCCAAGGPEGRLVPRPRRRPRRRRGWRSITGPIRRSTTAGSPTTAGSRNCPNR